MANAPKPKLNDLLKVNPGKVFTVAFTSVGKRLEGQYGASWLYSVTYNGGEYVYFANDEVHAQDIDRLFLAGKIINLSMVQELVNGRISYHWLATTEDGKTAVQANTPMAYPSQTKFSKPVSTMTGTPNWDEISRGKCRHAYALEAFKALLTEKKTPQITPGLIKMIEEWTDYSMKGDTSNVITKEEEQHNEQMNDSLDQIPF